MLDGEVVIAGAGGLDFDALLQRIHPAESRINLLAEETPASFVAFDLLALGDDDLRAEPSRPSAAGARGGAGAAPAAGAPDAGAPPTGRGRRLVRRFEGAGLDGVVAKPVDLPYREDKRVMLKVKHERTADCVVAGFRWHKSGGVVGSLLLGLYDDGGTLHHVGVTASFTMARRKELVDELAPVPGGRRWTDHPWRDWADGAEADAGRPRCPAARAAGTPGRT